MPALVAVVGGTGVSGRYMLEGLARAAVPTRAIVRDPARTSVAEHAGAGEVVVADLTDQASLIRAFDGATAIQMTVPGPATPGAKFGSRGTHDPVEDLVGHAVAAAIDRSVPSFVLNTVLHSHSPGMPHHMEKARAEVVLKRSGLDWTILQPASYAQNFVYRAREESGQVVFDVPYSRAARISPVDLYDVAEVCALVHGDPSAHRFASYELAGPEVLDTDDIGRIIAGIIDRPVEVREVPPSAAIAPDTPLISAAELTAMFAEYDRYGFVGSANVLRQLLGRSPNSVEDVLRRDGRGFLPGY